MAARGLLALVFLALAAPACGGDGEGAGVATSPPFPEAETYAVETTVEPEPPAADPGLRVTVTRGHPIGPGSRGQHVVDLQRALTALGYDPGEPDGLYGPKTRRAILAFQKQHQLRQDGLVGQGTARAINEELEALGGAGAG